LLEALRNKAFARRKWFLRVNEASQRPTYTASTLNDLIVECIEDKKGLEIVSLDLREINDAIADYFIICHADSHPGVKAIADHIVHKVHETNLEKPWKVQGMENQEWVIVDYVDIVVHVFHREQRHRYKLEELWADARFTKHS
jgi:ribosome-associated protein